MDSFVTTPNPALLSTADLANRWQVSPRTLQRWRLGHEGPAFCRIGRSIRYCLEDVLAFEKQRSVPPEQERRAP